MVIVPIGVIDGDKSDWKPRIEYWCTRRAAWLGDVGSKAAFDTLPNPEEWTAAVQ
jgi:hypothetical protein